MKKKNSNSFIDWYVKFGGLIYIIVGIYLVTIAFSMFKGEPSGYIIAIPIIGISLFCLAYGIYLIAILKIDGKTEKKEVDIYTLINKLSILFFIIIWFAFLIFMTYMIIKNKDYIFIPFIIPFWCFGAALIYKFLKDKK